MGSLCASTMRMILCLEPALYAAPCCAGVYLHREQHTHHTFPTAVNVSTAQQQHMYKTAAEGMLQYIQ